MSLQKSLKTLVSCHCCSLLNKFEALNISILHDSFWHSEYFCSFTNFFLFLFKLLQDLLAKFECKYSNWAVTVSGLISMSYKIGCCQSSEDHGCRLYLIGSSREIVYLQISCVFGVSVILFVINYSVCWKITSVLAFSLGAWDSGLLNSNENCF